MKGLSRGVRRRIVVGLALALVLSAGAGCTYMRLNSFRRQLAKFGRYVVVAAAPAPTVVFREPVLEPKDLDWLLGLVPSSCEVAGADAVSACYQFQKVYPNGETTEPMGAFDLPVEATYVKGKLARVQFSERIVELLNTESITALFQQVSAADIHTADRRASWSVGEGLHLPAADRVLALCGSPYEETETDQYRVFRYCYRLPTQTNEAEVPCGEATLNFRKDTGRLETGWFRFGHLDITLRTSPAGKGSILLKRRA